MNRHRIRRGALPPLLFALLSALAGAQEAPRVTAIEFQGKFRIRPSYIQDNMKIRVGEPYDEAKADEDMKMIFDRFRLRAEFIREEASGGVKVIVRLHEDLPVKSVAFRGVKSREEKELRAKLGLDEEALPDRYQLRSYAGRIRDYFRDKGFYFAEVALVPEDLDGGVRLTFDVYKGKKVTVEEIRFTGLEAIDEGDLRSIMKLDEPTLWIFTDKLKEDVLEKDLSRLNEYLRREGYLDGRVALDGIRFDDDFDGATIELRVHEGKRYRIRKIRVEGTEAFPPERIEALIQVKPGDPYREARIERDLRRIQRFYWDRGYIRATVGMPERRYDVSQPLVDLVFKVQEGMQKTLRDVVITGNTYTQDKVVRREITLYPGEIIKQKELSWSFNELRALNYFTNEKGGAGIRMRTLPAAEDPQLEDLLVDVTEGGTGFFNFNIGVNSDIGLIGGVSVNKKNFDLTDLPSSPWAFPSEFFSSRAFHGGGQSLRLDAMPGVFESRYGVSFYEPYLFDTEPYPYSLGLDLSSIARDYSDYDRRILGFTPTVGRRWSRKLYTSLGLRNDSIRIYHVDEDAPADVKAVEGGNHIRSLIGRISYREVDRPFDPTRGYSTFLRYEYAGAALGGNVDLSKAIVEGKAYLPVYETEAGLRHVLAFRASLGWVEPHGKTDQVPIFERLAGGGVIGYFPLRGFSYEGVGPREGNTALKGNGASSFSVEYVIPLISEYDRFYEYEESRLKGVFFLDAGNVVRNIKDRDFVSRIRTSYGAGIRLNLPVLGGIPISLYYGIPYRIYPEDERRSFNINISTGF